MTTAHRAQLESRKGGKEIDTSIQHARLLPSHKVLKYRNEAELKAKYEQLKQDLMRADSKDNYQQKMLQVADMDSSDDEVEVENDDEDDESDDEEQLLRELEKIRRERQQQIVQEPKPVKKSWRTESVFKRKQTTEIAKKENTEYINDLVRSQFHKKFLDKYVK